MSEPVASAGSSSPRRPWHDREPLTIWLPLSALVAGVVQTVAYAGYKFFYNSFGIRPEEVGYDYASLLPRTAYVVALLVSIALVVLALVSLTLAFYVGLLKPMLQDFLGGSKPSPAGRLDNGLAVAMVPFAATVVVSLVGAAQLAGWAFLSVGLTAVVVEHVRARNRNVADSSVLMRFLAPRTYRGARRVVLIAVASIFPGTLALSSPVEAETVAFAVLMVYALDRMVPVVDPPEATAAPGGGTSPWLWRVGVLGLAGAISLIFVANLPKILGSSDLESKVTDVRAGGRLTYDLLNPLALAEPRADPVNVLWVGADPPRPFSRNRAVRLTYFGQNAGTSVFLDTAAGQPAVYRLPTAAVMLQASAKSVLSSSPAASPVP